MKRKKVLNLKAMETFCTVHKIKEKHLKSNANFNNKIISISFITEGSSSKSYRKYRDVTF